MSIYYNDKIWVFDESNKKKIGAGFSIVRKLFVSNIPTEVNIEITD